MILKSWTVNWGEEYTLAFEECYETYIRHVWFNKTIFNLEAYCLRPCFLLLWKHMFLLFSTFDTTFTQHHQIWAVPNKDIIHYTLLWPACKEALRRTGAPFREAREGHQAKQVPKVRIKFHIVLCCFIAHPHLLVLVTNERFLPAGATFGIGLASENHWLVLTIHWWPTPVSVGGLLVKSYNVGSLGPSRALHSHKYERPWTIAKMTIVN